MSFMAANPRLSSPLSHAADQARIGEKAPSFKIPGLARESSFLSVGSSRFQQLVSRQSAAALPLQRNGRQDRHYPICIPCRPCSLPRKTQQGRREHTESISE